MSFIISLQLRAAAYQNISEFLQKGKRNYIIHMYKQFDGHTAEYYCWASLWWNNFDHTAMPLHDARNLGQIIIQQHMYKTGVRLFCSAIFRHQQLKMNHRKIALLIGEYDIHITYIQQKYLKKIAEHSRTIRKITSENV